MSNSRGVEPKHYDVNTVDELPDDKPLAIFDCDGTVTRDEGELLMATFVRSEAMDAMSTAHAKVERERLINLFDAWKEGKFKYEPYLKAIGGGYAQMLKASGLTRPRVMELGERWFQEDGYNEVLPIARPMVRELDGFRFNSVMATGAPLEVAHSFAAYTGMGHVFAMNADVNPDGTYSGRMFSENNTGILNNKGAICRKIQKRCATGFGAGNTQSDTVIMETAYLLGEKNPIDMKGFAFLMNTDQVDDLTVERFMKSAGHRHAEFGFFCIPKNPDVDEFINFFRSMLRGTLIKNGYANVVHEIEGVRPLTPAEKEELRKKREQDPDCWVLNR